MSHSPMPDWVPISEPELDQFLEQVNWKKEGWGDMDFYVRAADGVQVAAKYDDGRCYLIPWR